MVNLGDFHFKFHKGKKKNNKRIVAIDTEWAKNWKAKEKVIPFCCSCHIIYVDNIIDVINIDDLHMESEIYFRSSKDTIQDYIDKVEAILSGYISDNTIFAGHQLSSDLHTFIHSSRKSLDTISYLIESLKLRKKKHSKRILNVVDTRYDIKNRIRGNGCEKLRNVSLRYKIYAVQNELNDISLTKMYNQYSLDKDINKMEKLLIINWRHAFQTALVCLLDMNPCLLIYNSKFDKDFLATNDIIKEMGECRIKYLNSEEYKASCTIEGTIDYIEKHAENKLII